ncbi:MAG: hypothetical protein WDO74_16165 [Pseudomonadota bacterium]
MLGCHAQQNFPGPPLGPAPASAQLQLFEPPSSLLDAQPTLTDLSALNGEPAGAHGFVHPSLGHFIDDRGSRLRFFGVNLSGVACLPDHETALRLARHLRKLGFNAVRLHSLDAPGVLLAADGQIVPEALAQLDHFTAALKAEGIYFSLGLHASGSYPGLEAVARQRFPQGKVLDRFHPPFLDAQRDFARRLLSHRNPETQLEYRAEPALLYVELNNEDTIFPSSAGSPDDVPAEFRAELAKGYAPWIAQRTADGLRAPGPADEEAKAELPTFQAPPAARADYAQYLRERERSSVLSLTEFVRGELGLQSMLLNSQVSFGGLAGVLREAEVSDFIDAHGYWSSPDRPQITAPDAGTWGKLASYRVFGKPFVVSAYGTAAPNDYAAEMFPLLIGIAGLQDWDAVFAFAYADQKREYEPGRINGVFDLAGHPAKLAFLSSAAAAFRRGLVAPGQTRVELNVPEQPSALPYAEDALPSLWSEHSVSPSAAAIQQMGISLRPGSGDVMAGHALRVSGALGSDTGELLWDAQGSHARFSIDAPALKAVCGMLSRSALDFGGVSFEFQEFSPGFACASLLSLDDAPIASARRLLFSVSGLARNGRRSTPGTPNEVALAQYVPITVTLPRGAWHADALDAAGNPVRALAVVNAAESKISTAYQGAALAYAFSR